jgi:hypothetical protein
VTYRILSVAGLDKELKQARIAYETEKFTIERKELKRRDALQAERFRIKHANLQRYDDLNFYGVIGIISVCGIAVLIVAAGYSRAKVKHASVYVAKIGQHSEIPIHQKDLQSFYPIAVNLSLAEIEASASTAHEKAYRISRQMLEDITDYTRALAGKRGLLAQDSQSLEGVEPHALPIMAASPTCEALLQNGMLTAGKPLILGYDRQGHAQMRSLQDLKSLAVAGWQGSGKTLSMGYLVASSILAYGVQVYVIDPHKQHPESLSSLITPLEQTGHITIINPFDTPVLLEKLNRTLDRRLSGEESSSPGILLMIDEMARLAKMECFETLVTFLERCTEETRKANITFIGASHKWTARHFKGRADIRACMNSMLIHKTKPSQADLLLEDAQDKNLVKQIQRPGEAILVTDYDQPTVVSIPFCTRKDMHTIANMIGRTSVAESQPILPAIPTELETPATPGAEPGISHAENSEPEACTLEMSAESQHFSSEVIPFERHRKSGRIPLHSGSEPGRITRETLVEMVQLRKEENPGLTQAEIARRAGMSQSYLSRLLNGKVDLKDKYAQTLYRVLCENGHSRPPRLLRSGLKKAAG